jgi:hypothetical protein
MQPLRISELRRVTENYSNSGIENYRITPPFKGVIHNSKFCVIPNALRPFDAARYTLDTPHRQPTLTNCALFDGAKVVQKWAEKQGKSGVMVALMVKVRAHIETIPDYFGEKSLSNDGYRYQTATCSQLKNTFFRRNIVHRAFVGRTER